MKLRDVISAESRFEAQFADLDVAGICADSRTVRPGDIFAALSGTRTEGARFIAAALEKGARAVLAQGVPTEPLPAGVALVQAPNARRELALAAARFFPQQPEMIAAVTGTSGKTSVAAFLRQIWERLGYSAASLGTVGIVSPKGETYGSLTTPDPVALHRALDELARDGVTHLAIEASSHGLDQHRLDGLRLRVGGYTNLSRDHLDYHPTMEDYLTAKLRLFTELLAPGATAVINADDEQAAKVIGAAAARALNVMTVGVQGRDLALKSVERHGFGQRVRVEVAGTLIEFTLPLVGNFQVENALVAAGMAVAAGGEATAVLAALEHLQGAKGRLELTGTHNDAPVFIDYAHKPDALAKALDALRPYTRRRLVVVFGCGGDRDQGKRPIMGAIAAAKADRVIVTDDNPRSEEAAAIRRAIMAAAPGATEIGDRAAAIRTAVSALEPGDLLLVAGKGHESGQIVGDRVLPFSDHEAVAAALKEKAA